DLSSFKFEFLLRMSLVKVDVRHTVLYQNDLFFRNTIDGSKEVDRLLAHYYDSRGHFPNLLQYLLFIVGRRFKYGVERYHQRNLKPVKQGKDVNAVLATENPDLMLEDTKISTIHIDKIRCLQIVALLLLLNDQLYFLGIGIRLPVVTKCYNESFVALNHH